MKVLKDIKISKNRIPVQNALWIRPMGSLSFKLYIPSGVDWREVGIDNKPSPSPTPSGKKSNCEGGKVIIGKCIPKYPMVGDRYYFADGIVKFKKHQQSSGSWIIIRYDAVKEQPLGETSDTPDNLCRGNRHCPIVVTITKAGLSCMENVKISKIQKYSTPYGPYSYYSEISKLTCDTTSPHFKIINGQLRHIIPEDLGEFYIPEKKFMYSSPYPDFDRGHRVRRLTRGWALLKLKTRNPSKNDSAQLRHKSVKKRRVIKLWSGNIKKKAPAVLGSMKYTSSIIVRKIAKRRISNPIKAVMLNMGEDNRAKITTFGRRL